MARVDAAHVAPNFLAMTIEIIEYVSADRDIVKFLQQAELGQFADRVRQGVDADPELADGVGLFEQFTSDAAGAKHQRRGQTTDTATDDNYFHRLNSTQPALSAHETRRTSSNSLPFGLFGRKRLCGLPLQLGTGLRLSLNFKL